MPKLKLNGHIIEYSIRKSKRAKRISMRVDVNKGLEVIYPASMKHAPPAQDILTQHAPWVLEAINRLHTHHATRFQRRYQHGEIFRYLGKDYTLNIITKSHGQSIAVSLSETTLDVSIPQTMPNDTDTCRHAIETFYRTQAKQFLPKRTREIARQYGCTVNRIVIKNQKTRWGSCSSNQNINLNLRLMMAQPEAIDYIIIHELCHLTHMNHSQAFWGLVQQRCPRYQHWRQWFKDNTEYLVL